MSTTIIESKKRKFEVQDTKSLCCKCNHRIYSELSNRTYRCLHCDRKFCYSCYNKEHNDINQKTRITYYYGCVFQGLEQCSYCVNCDQQKNVDIHTNIIDPSSRLQCLGCCVNETTYNSNVKKIIQKKHALDNLKLKLKKDYEESINNINSNLNILGILVNTIPTEISNEVMMKEEKLDKGRNRKSYMNSTLNIEEYLHVTECGLKSE